MLLRQKELVDRAGLNRLRRATDNGAWLAAIPHCLNGTYFSSEEFQNNLLLRYGIVFLNLPTDFDGFGKKLSVPHASSCPKGGLVLAQYNDADKEWGSLLARAINPSDISYETKTNSSTVQWESNGAGAWVMMGKQEEEEQDGKEGETG